MLTEWIFNLYVYKLCSKKLLSLIIQESFSLATYKYGKPNFVSSNSQIKMLQIWRGPPDFIEHEMVYT